MKHLFAVITLLLLLSSCDNESNTFMPERLLTEEEMIDIMTDVQIIEADINYQKTQESNHNDSILTKPIDPVKLSRLYYDQLFEHYGITDSIFTQNIKYYTEQTDILERIMDSVVQRLTREQSTSSTQ